MEGIPSSTPTFLFYDHHLRAESNWKDPGKEGKLYERINSNFLMRLTYQYMKGSLDAEGHMKFGNIKYF